MKKIQLTKGTYHSSPKSLLFLLVMIMACNPITGFAQQINPQVTCSGGETFTNSTYSLDFAIGEISTESLSGSNILLTQGFIQGLTYGIGIEEKTIATEDIMVYPNPSANQINLISKAESNPVTYEVKDIYGNVIISEPFVANPTLIDVCKLSAGFYAITFRFKNCQSVTKKLIKK